MRIVVRTSCLFAMGEASDLQGRVLVGTKKIRISVYGLLGDKPPYRHSLDYQDHTIETSERACRGGVCLNCWLIKVRLSVKE